MEEKIEALQTAIEYIDNIKLGVENLVNKINSGEENNGILLITQVADGVEWLISVIRLTIDLHKGNISTGDMNEKLGEIIEALENEDYVLVGDLFNYEFLPVLENMQEDIRKIIF